MTADSGTLKAWRQAADTATHEDAARALGASQPGGRDLACLLSPAASALLEPMAQRAQRLTRHHFGRTVSLYVPLYLSNFCGGGCVYCGFASDRRQPRRRLELEDVERECRALAAQGFDDILLLTGERCAQADHAYLRDCVAVAARHMDAVSVEAFAMGEAEYAALVSAGCTGVTLYQETYDPQRYDELHRWGEKRDYDGRRDAADRALAAGTRVMGLGALLGLTDPISDMLALYAHVIELRKTHWRAGLTVSFPRLRPERGDYESGIAVGDRLLAQIIYAFRIALPDVGLVLSTREAASFRDGMAGVGINRMSVASRTSVGGYAEDADDEVQQFEVNDHRGVEPFCAALQAKGLEPVFKNWDAVYR